MVRVDLLQLQAHKLFCSLLHYIKHVADAVTLLQTLLVALKLIPEVLDNEPFQTLCFLVAGCVSNNTFSKYGDLACRKSMLRRTIGAQRS